MVILVLMRFAHSNVELIPNDDYEVELHLTEMLSGERKITKQLFWNEMKG